jgi:hypothetical protein
MCYWPDPEDWIEIPLQAFEYTPDRFALQTMCILAVRSQFSLRIQSFKALRLQTRGVGFVKHEYLKNTRHETEIGSWGSRHDHFFAPRCESLSEV